MGRMETSSLRVYGGVRGQDRQSDRRLRLIDAGLDLLGGAGGEANLTVRGACKRAGLAARYFYENFAGREALALAVYDHVVEEIARTTLEAVRDAPTDARSKTAAGLDNIVREVAEDPRRGRLLFSAALSDGVFAQRRAESSRVFAGLLVGQAKDFYDTEGGAGLELASQFLVGGLSQALTAWLEGTLEVTHAELVDHCTELFLSAAETTSRRNSG